MKKEKEYMKFIEDHHCKILEQTKCDICVTKYQLPNKDTPEWFWCNHNQLDAILYCPYCGKELK